MPRHAHRTSKESRRVDHSLGGDRLRAILARDGWALRDAGPPPAATAGAVFVAHKNGRQIAFFFSDQPAKTMTAALRRIARQDRGRFKRLGVVVAPTTEEMQRLRAAGRAAKFPRAFFASLEEIGVAAAGGTPVTADPASSVQSFDAQILANEAIGHPQPSHYRLVFRAPELQTLQPPQFLMMDTTPARVPLGKRSVGPRILPAAVDLAPRPLLKRPFGIYRVLHPDFAGDWLKRLRLPASLALVLHTGYADRFDMLYKVLPNGIGTPLMAKLKRGQTVHMLGPLGQPFDVRRLRAEGVEEIHVIGGGVGMAPLILLVEALRFYSFPVKVFLGIATLESLRYRDELAATFGEKPRDAYIYIDDLLAAGMQPADLYVSCDKEKPKDIRGIPPANLYHGLLPDQYREFLAAHCPTGRHPEPVEGSPSSRGNGEIPRQVPQSCGIPTNVGTRDDNREARRRITAFTCGPNRMMEIVAEIARQAGVDLKVLLEKRMGCGIGVCFSCVCPVRRPTGTEDYARVCIEGPLFDAKDILWKNDDSKPPSAGSNCAARC